MAKKSRQQKRKEQVDENARFQAELKRADERWIVSSKGQFTAVSRHGRVRQVVRRLVKR